MKSFNKINRGLLFTLAVLLVTAIYLISLTVRVKDMKKEAERFMNGFLAADAGWKVIPEEYRDDYAGYVKKIEPEVRRYFAEDGAYEYYIENNIHEQYRKKNFYKSCSIFIQDIYDPGYNDGVLSIRFFLGISGKTDQNETEFEPFRNTYRFSFKRVDGELKIYYLNYSLENSGAGSGIYSTSYVYGR